MGWKEMEETIYTVLYYKLKYKHTHAPTPTHPHTHRQPNFNPNTTYNRQHTTDIDNVYNW